MTTGGRRWLTVARLCCTLLLLAGCTLRSGTASLQPGISTKQDIYQRFGQPVEVLAVEGGSIWLYAQALARRQGTRAEVILTTVRFDGQGRYQRVDTRRARRVQPQGSSTGGTPLGDAAAAHVREEMERFGLPFDEAAWDTSAQAHRLWTQPPTASE